MTSDQAENSEEKLSQSSDLIDRFEEAWLSGVTPNIGDYLPQPHLQDKEMRSQLVELVKLDLEFRWRGWRETKRLASHELSTTDEEKDRIACTVPSPWKLEDYLERLPGLGPLKDIPIDLIKEEYWVRCRWGDQPPRSEYRYRFAGYSAELETVFDEVHDEMAVLGEKPEPGVTPQRLGRYQLGEELGGGSYGKVYRAYDPRLDRTVAVKVSLKIDSVADRNRLLEEARRIACLDHPGIVPVYDTGVSAGRCFLVSKIIDGLNLREKLQTDNVSAVQAAHWCAQVADSLSFAHCRGIYHRDVKPENILVDAEDRAHLTDFGLSVSAARLRESRGYLTGTLPYLAPEQVRGEGHLIDGRADVYSLGLVLYELLSGSRPFVNDSAAELMEEIENREAQPIRQTNNSIPRELDAICQKALSKKSSERFNTAHDMAARLRDWISGNEASPALRQHRQSSLQKYRMVAAVVTLLMGTAFCLGVWYRNGRSDGGELPAAVTGLPAGKVLSLIYSRPQGRVSPKVTGLAVRVLAQREGESEFLAIADGATLSERDQYAIETTATRQGYLYLFQVDAMGNTAWFFPDNSTLRESSGTNPLANDKRVRFPEDKNMACYLDRTLGVEHIYAVLSDRRWLALEESLASSHSATNQLAQGEVRFRGVVQQPNLLGTRGFGGVEAISTAADESAHRSVVPTRVFVVERWFRHVP